jgi:hypothetical protein
MYLDIFRKQYDFELEQRHGLTSATNIPVVAITVAASAISVILLDYKYSRDLLSYFFGGFASLSLLTVAFSFYSLFRSFWNYEYHKLPNAKALRQHSEGLHEWHLNNGSSLQDAVTHTNADFTDYLTNKIAEAADWNSQNNVVRGNYLHRATVAIALGVTLFFPAALMYAYNKAVSEDKIHQVRITESVVLKQKEPTVSNNQSSSSPSQTTPAPTPAPAATPLPSAKPAGPPNSVFRGNSDLTKPVAGPVYPKK